MQGLELRQLGMLVAALLSVSAILADRRHFTLSGMVLALAGCPSPSRPLRKVGTTNALSAVLTLTLPLPSAAGRGRFVSGYAFRHAAEPKPPWKSGASAPRKAPPNPSRKAATECSPEPALSAAPGERGTKSRQSLPSEAEGDGRKAACVERTLPSALCDAGFDFDFDLDLLSQKRRGCPILARSLRKGGNHGRLQRLPLELDVAFDSCPNKKGTNREGHDVQFLSLP